MAWLLTILLKLPKMNNHGVFIFVVAATILIAGLRVKLADRGSQVTPARLYAAFAPALRFNNIGFRPVLPQP